MNNHPVQIKCTQCGQPNVKPKTFVTESKDGTQVVQYKWVCHRCGLLVRKANQQG